VTQAKSTNIRAVEHQVALEERWRANGHRSGILWFTGLPGSGKTTLSLELERALFGRGFQACVLDGDNIRHGLSEDLGFSAADRSENIRRVGEVAKLFAGAGMVVITAFISPYRADRERVRAIGGGLFHEVFIDAPVEVCERRDPKGHYAKARRGEIPFFTGVSAPYEPPPNPDLRIDTARWSVQESVERLIQYAERSFRPPPPKS
jgi:adenylyl-sulfate kinase